MADLEEMTLAEWAERLRTKSAELQQALQDPAHVQHLATITAEIVQMLAFNEIASFDGQKAAAENG